MPIATIAALWPNWKLGDYEIRLRFGMLALGLSKNQRSTPEDEK
jgi:hypothetical protein